VAIAQLLSGRHFGNNKDQEPGISAKKKRCRDEQKESDSRLAKLIGGFPIVFSAGSLAHADGCDGRGGYPSVFVLAGGGALLALQG